VSDALAQLGALPASSTIGVSADLRSLSSLRDLLNRGSAGQLPDAQLPAVRALLGSVVSLSVTSLVGEPAIRLVLTAADPADAASLSAAVSGLAGPAATLSVQENGSTVSITSRRYQPGTGTLADDPGYQKAMAGAPRGVLLAGYVNVQALLPALQLKPADAAQLKPVQAVGVSAGVDGGDIEGLLRVVVP
jgi:hypothetical protein